MCHSRRIAPNWFSAQPAANTTEPFLTGSAVQVEAVECWPAGPVEEKRRAVVREPAPRRGQERAAHEVLEDSNTTVGHVGSTQNAMAEVRGPDVIGTAYLVSDNTAATTVPGGVTVLYTL